MPVDFGSVEIIFVISIEEAMNTHLVSSNRP